MIEQFSFELLAFLFTVGLIAGFVDAVAGGGGLITLPALLYTGMSPLGALATNKFQGSFGTAASTINFFRHGQIDLRKMAPAVLMTSIGAAMGTLSVEALSTNFLHIIMPFLLFSIAIFFAAQPKLGDKDRHQRIGLWSFSLLCGFSIGFYDGFFGPGAGSFFTLGFVLLLGFNLVKATANTKLLNFTSNLISLLFFILGGHVVWTIGLVMAAGQFAGGMFGAQMTMQHGTKLIRPMVIIISLALTGKLIFDNFAA